MSRTSFARGAAVALVLVALDPTAAPAADDPPSRATSIVVRVDDGFSWSDAGIGAVAGAGAALAAVGGLTLMRSSSSERPQSERSHGDH